MNFKGFEMNSATFWVLVFSAAGIIVVCNVIINLAKKYSLVRRLAVFPSAPCHWFTGHRKQVSLFYPL